MTTLISAGKAGNRVQTHFCMEVFALTCTWCEHRILTTEPSQSHQCPCGSRQFQVERQIVAETGSSVPEEESGPYQPTKKDLRVLFGLLLAGAGVTLFALYGVWCAVEKVMRGLGL